MICNAAEWNGSRVVSNFEFRGGNAVSPLLCCQVADFGLSRILGDADTGMTACGTPAWTAPEIIRNIASGERYTEKVGLP